MDGLFQAPVNSLALRLCNQFRVTRQNGEAAFSEAHTLVLTPLLYLVPVADFADKTSGSVTFFLLGFLVGGHSILRKDRKETL